MKSLITRQAEPRRGGGISLGSRRQLAAATLFVFMTLLCGVSAVPAEDLRLSTTPASYAAPPAAAPAEKGEALTPIPEAPVLEPPPPNVEEPYPTLGLGFGLAQTGPSPQPQRNVLFPNSCLERFGERYEEAKEGCVIPITVGAWHWFHVNTGGPLASGYGIPGENGTYFYSISAAPEFQSPVNCFSKCGAYTEIRLRDGGTPFRPFYPNDVIWPYQAYLWGCNDSGTLKGGLIWRRFGLDWDGSFWGNTAYFDGFQLSTGWGLSWESTPKMENGFKVDRYFQFFIKDYLDGSLVGADPNSVNGSTEQNTGIIRVVPTWQLSKDETLAVGVSALVGQVQNQPPLALVTDPNTILVNPGDQTMASWAVDLTYTKGNLKVFGEGLQSYGILNPDRYVSGGPSNRITDLLVGFNWTHGPVIYRFCYSLGLDDDPSGTQHLFVPGVTVALTKNVEFYGEYVFQEVRHSGTQQFTTFENGIQAVLHWQF